jgi:hypothetical protein
MLQTGGGKKTVPQQYSHQVSFMLMHLRTQSVTAFETVCLLEWQVITKISKKNLLQISSK